MTLSDEFPNLMDYLLKEEGRVAVSIADDICLSKVYDLCLDKQRVKEVLEKFSYRECEEWHDDTGINIAADSTLFHKAIQELGLDKQLFGMDVKTDPSLKEDEMRFQS